MPPTSPEAKEKDRRRRAASQKRVGDDGLTYSQRSRKRDPERTRATQARDRNKHAVKRKAYNDDLYARNREIVVAAKDVPCVDCGNRYPACAMDFDHVRGEKHYTVSRMLSFSVERVLAEIAKCDVRCANCHRIKHFNLTQPAAEPQGA